MKPQLLTLTLLALFISYHPVEAETLRELLNRFDKNGDHQLDEQEFAAAQAAFDLPTKTARGAERAKVAREAVNAAARKFPDADLKYMKRAAQAHLLLTKKAGPAAESVFNIRDQLLPNLSELSTYERFIINRWIADQRILKTEGAPIGSAPPVSDPFTTFMENNFRIRKTGELISGDPVSDEPAKFSWTDPRGQSSFYSVDAAILYTPSWLDWQWDKVEAGKVEVSEEQWLPGGRLRPAFEAHISTQDGASRNQLKYSALFQGRYKYFPGNEYNARPEALPPGDLPFFSAHYIEIAPVYVTDREASVRTWGCDFRYEPSIPWLNLNHDVSRKVPLFNQKWLEGRMTGAVGFNFRQYEQGTPAAVRSDNYGGFMARYSGELVFFHKLTLTASYNAEAYVWGDIANHDFFELDAQLLLDDKNHYTVGMSYLNGEQEPTFTKVDTFTAWVGLKF